MREEKEIREALKRLKDEHLRRARDPGQLLSPCVGSCDWCFGMGLG